MLLTVFLLKVAAPRWHLTSVAGHAGAAVAAAWLNGLDSDGVRNALGLALSVAGAPGATIASRANGRRWHRAAAAAAAAAAGVQAATAARAGTQVPADLFTAPNGALAAFTAAVDAQSLADRPGLPRVLEVSVRLYATKGFARGPVGAAAELRRHLGVAPRERRWSTLHPRSRP